MLVFRELLSAHCLTLSNLAFSHSGWSVSVSCCCRRQQFLLEKIVMFSSRFAMAAGSATIHARVEEHSGLIHGVYPPVNLFCASDMCVFVNDLWENSEPLAKCQCLVLIYSQFSGWTLVHVSSGLWGKYVSVVKLIYSTHSGLFLLRPV